MQSPDQQNAIWRLRELSGLASLNYQQQSGINKGARAGPGPSLQTL